MPKTLKILGSTYGIFVKKLPPTKKYLVEDSAYRIYINASLGKDDRNAAILSAVSKILSNQLPDMNMLALHWAIFIQDNVFDISWINPIISVDKKPASAPTATTTKNIGGDIRLLVRTGI